MSIAMGEERFHRKWMLIAIFVVAAVSAAGWFRLRVDSSLEPLLPENSLARQAVLFLRDSSFADKIVLWLRLRPGADPSQLFLAADQIESRRDPRLIKRVIRPPSESDALGEVFGMLDDVGELLNQHDFADLDQATTPDALRKRMRDCFVQLTKPQGAFMQQIMRRDPLGISTRILARLQALTSGLGFRAEIHNGRFVHPDGRQLMLILETPSQTTDLAGSEALVANLRQICTAAPPGVEIIPICGQIHTQQNHQIMERDTRLVGTINAIAFLLLFLLVSRDWRVSAVFMLPVVSILLTVGLCGLIYPSLSLMVIGVAVTMAGSAVDYGIYVYTAVSMGTDPASDIRRIRRPLLISHLTTLGVFFAFLFSDIPAYRQLGCLTSVSLVLSLLAALFVLPGMIRPGGKIKLMGRGMALQRWGRMMVPATLAAGGLLIVAVFFARKISFEQDLNQLDGTSPSVKQAEKDFQKTWGRSETEMAMLVVSGKTPEQAEEANDQINAIVSSHFPEGQFVSLSSFWPSAATRAANLARWQGFWTDRRVATVRKDLAAAGASYGFTASAFDPFFQSLAHPPSGRRDSQLLASIDEQFVAHSQTECQMLSFFDDTDANVSSVRALVRDRPDAQVVSRRAVGHAFAEAAASESRSLIGISVIFIIISLLALTRSPLKSLLIMLPALVGLVALLAILGAASLSMNIVTVVAVVLVLALASDYGVFAVYAWDNHETLLGQGMASVHLSALTTLVGTGALLLARHPALYLVGVTLTSGLLAGYLTAFLVIPGICFLRGLAQRRRAT